MSDGINSVDAPPACYRQPAKISAAALKLKPACQYLGGISEITLRRLIARGLIKPNRSLRHIIIPVSELNRFLSN
jgi:Helix-turn-helix domain